MEISIKKKILIFLFSTVLFVGGGLKIIKADAQNNNLRNVLCVLKSNNKGKWTILENETHINRGCQTISQDLNSVIITYSPFIKIAGNDIEEDNLLLAKDIHSGASVGLDRTIIQFYKDGKLINPKLILGNYTNIFVSISGEDETDGE